MADIEENFDEPMGNMNTAAAIAVLPDIKLFGRWSCDDVQVDEMSLQVNIQIKNYLKVYMVLQYVLVSIISLGFR